MSSTIVLQDTQIIDAAAEKIKLKEKKGCTVVVITGIDASGKTTLAKLVDANLRQRGFASFLVHLDNWHHPSEKRFNKENWAENYYRNAYRFNDLFEQFLLPLKLHRSIHLEIELLDPAKDIFYPHTYHLDEIDVVIIEGIFLLKQEYRSFYDYAVWIECSTPLALERAIKRNQEQMDEKELQALYNTVFFPAQRIHHLQDDPKSLADAIYLMD